MALVARGVDSGSGINVLADAGSTGDMQVVKLAISTLGSEALVPADATNGMDVDVTRVIPGTTATSLGKAEDAVAVSGDTGVFVLAIQRNTPASDAADGDYVGLHTDSTGRLQVTPSGSGGGAQVEDTPASSGDTGVFNLAVRRDTPTSGAAAGDYHEMEVDSLGRLWVTGTQAEDAAATSGDTGHFVLAVRRDAPTSGAAAGDYHELEVDALGRLWTSGTFAEDAAAVSGDYGKFVLAIQRNTAASDAADGDYVGLHTDSLGRLQVTGTQIEDAVAASGDPGQFMLAVRRDTATSGAAAGDYHELQVDATGYMRTIDKLSEVALSSSTTTALDDDGPVVKGSAGTLYGFQGYSDAVGFVQVHNKATAPTAGNVPILVIPVTALGPFSLDLSMRGRAFSTGIAFGFSSTGPTYTNGGAHIWVDAQYV